jgi:hypothetical protein
MVELLAVNNIYPDCNLTKAPLLNISWDFDALCTSEVSWKRRMLTVVVPSTGDRQVVDIGLTLIASQPRFTNPPEMSSAGFETGRCRITAIRLLGSGIEGEVWEVIALEVRADG